MASTSVQPTDTVIESAPVGDSPIQVVDTPKPTADAIVSPAVEVSAPEKKQESDAPAETKGTVTSDAPKRKPISRPSFQPSDRSERPARARTSSRLSVKNGNHSRRDRDNRDNRMPQNDDFNGGNSRKSSGGEEVLQPIHGFVDVSPDGHAVIRTGFSQSRNDAYLSIALVRKIGIRPGDEVEGIAREPRENDRYWGLKEITSVNGKPITEARQRRRFEDLVPVYPKEKLVLETGKEPVSTRLIDLVAPIGKGQRGLIVSPPKAGKTTIMKEISTGIATNFPDVHLMAVLIGERPEEVTDIARHVASITDGKGETAASNFDEPAIEQTRVAEVALERAKRLVELGRDVVIVMDSITRLARAYNLAIPTSGRTLSGGFDPAALYPPKRFFGAARNFEEGGSLTIIATALVDTGSRMDDLVYEEFKGTGNMELHLDRRIAERRIFPAINVQRSGTRRDDLLFSNEDYQNVVMMHRMMDMLDEEERTAMVVRRLKETNNNKQFLVSLKS